MVGLKPGQLQLLVHNAMDEKKKIGKHPGYSRNDPKRENSSTSKRPGALHEF